MKSKRFLSTMLSLMATVIVLFALGGITVFADGTDEPEIVSSGYCGAVGNEENVSWTLDSNGLLTISGTGDFSYTVWNGTVRKVFISEGVTNIGKEAFYGCSSLTSVTIPDTVTYIGALAFSECRNLTSITIPDSVTRISAGAFYNCKKLTSVTIPNSVTNIDSAAFRYCSSLTSVTFPDSIIRFGDDILDGCPNLNSVVLNRYVDNRYAFSSCSTDIFHYYYDVNYSNSENGTVTGKQRSFGGDVVEFTVTPESNYVIDKVTLSYAGKTVEITPDANGKYKYTMPDTDSATISATFKAHEIIASGFCGAEGNGDNISWTLESNGLLTISGTGEMVDRVSFDSPWNEFRNDIITVDISEGVTNIGNYAFYDCTSLSSIDIPDSVTSIGESAFENCESLALIAIPNSVTSIGDETFYNCRSLTSVTIPDSVTSIGDGAFALCESLASITIPNSVTSIGNVAFFRCTSLTSITIPDSVTSIGFRAFCYTSLTSITIPNSVTSIGYGAFTFCNSLASVTISDNVTSIDYDMFCYCTSLTSITIPDSVTSIGDAAFYGCTSLSSIAIPDSVTSIGESAFYGCTSLSSITIPDSVTSIGVDAFRDCSNLNSVVLNRDTNVYIAFPNCSESVFHYYYDVNFSNSENGTVTGKQRSFGGDVVEFTVTPESNYVIDKVTLSYAGKTVEITPDVNGKYKYTMPDTDSATISATFKTNETLKIETEPVDFTGVIGEYATFTVVATGSDLKYQWQVDKNGTWTNCSVNDGAKTDTLTLEAKDSRDGTAYHCVITDKFGNKVTTKTVTLIVNNPLEIKIQPKDCSGYAGETTTFTVKANGSGLKYQWQVLKNGTWTNCSINDGAKTNKLTLEIKDSRNGCKYQCVVTDKNGNTVTTNEATLTVNKPLSIYQQPANVSGAEGETATFTVVAEGTGLKYQWQVYKNGAWTNCSVNDGAKTATLSLEIKSSRDGLKYQCVVTDKTGASVTSNEATLSLAKELTIVSEPETYVLAFEGYNAVFTIEAQGDGLKYQWQVLKNGTWTNCSINDGAKTNKLTLEAKQSRFGLQYHCIVSDKYGNEVTSKVSTLYVYDRPGTRSASDIAPATSEADVDIIEASDYVENADTVEITDFTEDTVEVVDVVEVSEVVEVTEVIEVSEAIETIPEVESDTAAVD